jgi:hypothetical protein
VLQGIIFPSIFEDLRSFFDIVVRFWTREKQVELGLDLGSVAPANHAGC